MTKFLAAIIVSLFALSANAALSTDSVGSAGFSKLTPQQQAEIISKTAAFAEANDGGTAVDKAGKALPSAEKVDKWVNVGVKIGQALGGAAREVGVAANEFATTPVGLLTVALIVWHFIGGMIVHVVGGVLILAFGASMILYVMRRHYPIRYTYDPEKKDWLGRPVITSRQVPSLSSDAACGYLFCVAVIIAASLMVMFTF